jgi:diguanylate cyclase (GGDEF)-like protein/PAS domain S-box-containing protein
MNIRSMYDPAAAAAGEAEHGSEQPFRSVVLNIPGAVYRRVHDEPWAMLFVSDHIEALTGYPASDFTGEDMRPFDSLVCVEDRRRVADEIRDALGRGGTFSVGYRLMDATGGYRWVAEHGRSVKSPDGVPLFIDGVILDLPARNEAEKASGLSRAADGHRLGYDALTCLPDRTLLRDRLQQIMLRSQRDHQLIAALLVDVDNFRSINDNLGQDAGDELLKAVAGRLAGVLRACDTIGRPGGDEFAILADGLSLSGGPELLAERLLDSLKEPFRVEGFDDMPLSITASIGIATNEGDEPDDLLRDAAIALCQAKTQGRNCHVRFKSAMRTAGMERLELETDLREALQENQFFLVYEPIFELDSVGVWGVEAFLRWRHPVRGIVEPEYFLPVLEDSGMILAVGSWVLKQACRQAVAWHRLGHDLIMSIKVSARELESDGFAAQLQNILSSVTLEPASLVIDVAEASLASAVDRLVPRLRELADLGVLVALDGFGPHSSLARVNRLPIGALKVDRSFVAAMSDSAEAIGCLHKLVNTCKRLGIDTFAEGIEQGWQLATLQKEQCRFGQGSLFSHPIPPEALEAILALEPLFA